MTSLSEGGLPASCSPPHTALPPSSLSKGSWEEPWRQLHHCWVTLMSKGLCHIRFNQSLLKVATGRAEGE